MSRRARSRPPIAPGRRCARLDLRPESRPRSCTTSCRASSSESSTAVVTTTRGRLSLVLGHEPLQLAGDLLEGRRARPLVREEQDEVAHQLVVARQQVLQGRGLRGGLSCWVARVARAAPARPPRPGRSSARPLLTSSAGPVSCGGEERPRVDAVHYSHLGGPLSQCRADRRSQDGRSGLARAS